MCRNQSLLKRKIKNFSSSSFFLFIYSTTAAPAAHLNVFFSFHLIQTYINLHAQGKANKMPNKKQQQQIYLWLWICYYLALPLP